ncbi:hypothetical protein LEMLEM_LOCUS16550 [Lemmus lemmus]
MQGISRAEPLSRQCQDIPPRCCFAALWPGVLSLSTCQSTFLQ